MMNEMQQKGELPLSMMGQVGVEGVAATVTKPLPSPKAQARQSADFSGLSEDKASKVKRKVQANVDVFTREIQVYLMSLPPNLPSPMHPSVMQKRQAKRLSIQFPKRVKAAAPVCASSANQYLAYWSRAWSQIWMQRCKYFKAFWRMLPLFRKQCTANLPAFMVPYNQLTYCPYICCSA